MKVPGSLCGASAAFAFFIALAPPVASAAGQQTSERQEISDRGPHWQRVSTIRQFQDEFGKTWSQTTSYVHLEPGLNYPDEQGNWIPAEDRFEIVNGLAVARMGQHRVILAGNLNSENPVDLEQFDGQRLISRPYALAYYDAESGQSVLIAELKDCQGEISGDNQVIYPGAFTDIQADVRYTYRHGGFEQDVVLRSQPPLPEAFGLNSNSTRLQIWTEFLSAPEPGRTAAVVNADDLASGVSVFPLTDETLDFGAMKMGQGTAFQLGEDTGSAAPMGKRWNEVDGRHFLIEEVEVKTVAPALDALPKAPDGAALRRPGKERETVLRSHSRGPLKARDDRAVAKAGGKERLLVLNRKPALVMDYASLTAGNLNNYTFTNSGTYYLSGTITCTNSNTTFEGGTVLKYASGAKLVVNTPVTWGGSFYQPVILTAKDDRSVGETVGTSTLSGYYANVALDLEGGTNTIYTLANLRIKRATTGIILNQSSAHVLSHLQITDCQTGISPTSTDFSLRNALFVNLVNAFNGSNSTVRIEHLTVDTATYFNYPNTFAAANLSLANSLLAAVSNMGSLTNTNKVAVVSSTSGLFNSVGGGAHYLVSTSPYRNLGATNLSSAGDIAKLTTYAPTSISGTLSVNTTLTPQVQRDTDTPDLGYHYAPLDWLASTLTVTNATLMVTNGAAIGFTSAACLWLRPSAVLVSQGLATQLNVFARYSCVQEASAAGAVNPGSGDTIVNTGNTGITFASAPSATCRQTAFYLPTPGGYSFYTTDGGLTPFWLMSSLTLKDCQFYEGSLWLGGTTNAVNVALNNDFAYRTGMTLDSTMTVGIYNILNRLGYLVLDTPNTNGWTVKDNAFDACDVVIFNANPVNGYNAYINGSAQLTTNGGPNTVLGSFNYATGKLGVWYQSSTNLINIGSRTGAAAGLYHYTTQNSSGASAKETTSTVDIGFHYIVTDSNGVPLDTDSDGIPDYLEDLDGDGTVDSGETDWNSSSDLGLRVKITEPKNNSIVP